MKSAVASVAVGVVLATGAGFEEMSAPDTLGRDIATAFRRFRKYSPG